MNVSYRAYILTGIVLTLVGGLLYNLERVHTAYTRLAQEADTLYQMRHYREALTTYETILERATTPMVRTSRWFMGGLATPATVALQIANCRYRLAEIELRQYQQTARDPRVTPRPSLVTVQRLLSEAGKAYAEVPATDPPIALAAQVNGTRVAAWQLILAAFDEPTAGRRSLRQQAVHAIKQAASAVDYGHMHREQLSRRERTSAMLLLETLTAFSQEAAPPSPPRPRHNVARERLGDLLLLRNPELSAQERQRFQDFFFALPLEAKDPWPTTRQDTAGAGQGRVTH
jgi:hypothetical protein